MNFNSVKFRLRAVVILVVVSFSIIAYVSIEAMQKTSDAIENMYSNGMINANRASEVLNLAGDARSQLLLAFQHEPNSEFLTMHNHPVSMHLDKIMDSLNQIDRLIQNDIMKSNLTGKQKELINAFYSEFKKLNKMGFMVSINEIRNNRYNNANKVLLTVINPKFMKINEIGRKFLNEEVNEGKETYEQAEEDIDTFIVALSMIALLVAGVILTLVWLILSRVDSALTKIEVVARDVSDGDLTRQVKLQGSDEFAILSDYVDAIVSKFKEVIASMNDSALQLSATADETSSIATQTKQNVIEQQQTQLVATAINEFSSTVQEVSISAASAAEASESAESATEEGKRVVQKSIDMIHALNNSISESSDSIQQLSQQSNQIGSVVDVIEDISEQTNLLALNAAIEAARAGEAGRGFAVVADEVRSLAVRTQKSTEEIKTMIANLQSGSKDSMQKMEAGSEQAQVTVEMANKAGQALDEISASVEKINSMNIQIATAAEQQSTVTNEINQNVTSINDISIQTAEGAEQSSSATLELANLTTSMREKVSHFKYL
ncbi:methyl-accepting chemotaxis protein [Vibrio salinus]|uniref:methyl-accepting chemotaxis protein n=1 Tax=Vibrio salinus TaxID=2899784 RepID=UPI001E59467E|nr:methyl-accepting chemotaxis protein [Vibrio salinus]MCE0494538.1 methyl-accepting chemotaxis protein [Vibrio salinus]